MAANASQFQLQLIRLFHLSCDWTPLEKEISEFSTLNLTQELGQWEAIPGDSFAAYVLRSFNEINSIESLIKGLIEFEFSKQYL